MNLECDWEDGSSRSRKQILRLGLAMRLRGSAQDDSVCGGSGDVEDLFVDPESGPLVFNEGRVVGLGEFVGHAALRVAGWSE